MKKILKKIIPNFLKKYLKKINRLRFCIKIYRNSEKSRKKDKKRVFLIFTPEHNNLGDHAIAEAELDILKDYDVFEITEYKLSVLTEYPKVLKRMISEDLIICTGGGFLGSLWFNTTEYVFRKVINLCGTNNNIIVFPQTIFYEDDEFGKEEFEKSKQIYNNCKNLILIAREKTSYEFMKSAYKNVFLIPDVVMYLNEYKENCKRNGVQITLRHDIEKTMSDEYYNNLIQFAENEFGCNVRFADMCIENDVSSEHREKALDEHFDKFRSSELVITDRLHGMIFSAITGTPCIVLNSKSPKVKGVYDWILKDCEYITFTDDFNEMKVFVDETRGKNFKYDNSNLMPYYDELKQIVKREISSE